MNKKFLSAILFGALMVTSTGTFVSCKDYDDDIDGLQTQVDANKADCAAGIQALQGQVAALQSALATAQSTADAAKKAAADAQNAADAAKKAAEAAAAQAKADAIAKAIEEVEALKAWVEGQNYVTNEDLAAALLPVSAKIAAIEETLDQITVYITETLEANIQTALKNIMTLQEDLAIQQAVLEEYEALMEELKAGDEGLWAELTSTREELQEAVTALNNLLEEETKGLWEEIALARQELSSAITALANIQADDKEALMNEINEILKANKTTSETLAALINTQADDKAELMNEIEQILIENAKLSETLAGLITSHGEDKAALEDSIAELKKALEAKIANLEEKLGSADATYGEEIAALANEIDLLVKQDLETANDIAALYNVIADNKADLEKQIADLKAELTASITAQVAALNETISATMQDKLDAIWAEINGDDPNSIRNMIGSLAGTIGAVQGELTTLHTLLEGMITNVSLFPANSTGIDRLYLYNVVEKAAVFGDKTAIKANENITFTAGKLVSYEDNLVIRVSPTNAVVTKEQVSLINTLGENLNEYLEITEVKPYDELFSGSWAGRAAENKSGLWTISFKLKEGIDPVKFADEVAQVKKNNSWYYVRYAVAIQNTATEGNVISGYNVEVATPDANSSVELDFYANDRSINDIRNRYLQADDLTSTSNIEELWWDDRDPEIEIPAVAPILEGDDKNVILKEENEYRDNRTSNPWLPVVKGEPITININSYFDGEQWIVTNKIAGFYVTLDKNYAVESVPSELNAWNSYEYENVGTDKKAATMIKGNSGTITIKDMNNVSGDVIGFRVYAVNLDGTLIDPDGRAFYVSIGDAAEQTQVVKATIAPKTTTDQVTYVALTEAQKKIITSLYGSNEAYDMDWANCPEVNGSKYGFGIEYVKDAEGTAISSADDIKYIKFTLWNTAQYYLNNGTYKSVLKYTNNRGNLLGEVEFELTKVLPTDFPATFSAKDKQIIEGVYTCYLQPTTSSWAVGSSAAVTGYMDLGSAFNGLIDLNKQLIDANYSFEFATSAFDGTKYVDNDVTAHLPADFYQLQVGDANKTAAEYIDAEVEHATKVYYIYRGISTYLDNNNNWVVGADHQVTWGTSFTTKYACWHNASTWAPVTLANNKITYADATGKKVDLANIKSTNSYNATLFTKTLKALVETDGYLKITGAKLTSNESGQEEYFDVDDTTLEFKPLKDDVQSNPKADVPSTLTITCEDCFGCEVIVAVPYTVKKQ